mmetsp:Transcript_7447/g.11631  ORF Transcript_7447/g.11631 Transcript_7447/m.11631 type:complete len:202 (-) Transcript_7447:307-912(-)|eukprot:CAMPEP_0170495374 /NCGR_PEP_ID=MMETSP0208-20121228/15274_1 /TAXON_ID=197538 /ORGANISM="Strombidium inclinatum, Strain S3" /LENGTH=201 /DNA_ID=CAMNT_0010771559 /DNA_START=227 /DNA_END=832 /DNA_ORIENTATION=-
MEGFLDVGSVEVLDERAVIGWLNGLCSIPPRSIAEEAAPSLLRLYLSLERLENPHSLRKVLKLFQSLRSFVPRLVHIVLYYVAGEVVELIDQSKTVVGDAAGVDVDVRQVALADFIIELAWVVAVEEASLDVGGSHIIGPVGNTITDHPALEVKLEFVVRVLVMQVEESSDVGDVDSGVGLAKDVKIMISILAKVGFRQPA